MNGTAASAATFSLSSRELADGTHSICVAGELDVHTAPDLRELMMRLADDGPKRLVVDLCSVNFIDSTAIGVLLARHNDLVEHGGSLAIACREGPVMRTFRTAGVDSTLCIYDTRADASAQSEGS